MVRVLDRWFAGCAFLVFAGCTGTAQLVLKPPIREKCEDVGLRGCDELSDGVVLFVDGDKDAAIKEIKRGAAKNAPEKLREFASAVKLLKAIPGAQQYTGPLLEVADLIVPDEGKPGSKGPHKSAAPSRSTKNAASSESTASESTASEPGEAQPAPDPIGRITFSLVPSVDTRARACSLFSEARWDADRWTSRCVRVVHGPIVVTDVQAGDTCHDRLVVGSGDPINPRWVIVGQSASSIAVHGAALFVPDGDGLFVAQASSGETPSQTDSSCLVTLSWRR